MKIVVRVRAFPGSDQERSDMVAAVRRHCACSPLEADPGSVAVVPEACAPHDLLAQEAALRRLVFYRRWHRARAERG